MDQKTDNFSMEQAKEIMNSPAGKQLISLLQQQAGEELRYAVARASAGDYTHAKELICAFLKTPQAQQLLGGRKE